MQSNNISKIFFLVISVATFISIFSCKKDTTTTPVTTTAMGKLILHFHTNVDTNEVDTYDTTYILPSGRKISVHLAQQFISHIQAVKLDGSVVDLSGVSILKTMENEEYLIGDIPVGNYKSVNFSVGLDAASNATSPTSSSIFNTSNMWFNSVYNNSEGYVFLNFQGKIDTTTKANGTIANMQPFVYRIGTNAHLINITMPEKDFTVLANLESYVHIIIDYSKLFTSVQLNQSSDLSVATVAENSSTVANKISNNILSIFSYE